MLRIKKNDTVYVVAGKDRGKTGKVIRVHGERVLVEGVNRVKKHMRRTREDQKGGIIEVERPLHISNVQVYCRSCSKPARVGASVQKDRTKVRVCRKCKEAI